MRLHIEPIYGSGWFRRNESVAVPPEFDVVVSKVESGRPFKTAIGLVSERNHLLDGLWIRLTARHAEEDGRCNLEAFKARPDLRVSPTVTGFVIATQISN